jgi:hypothetical protein
MTHSLPPPPVLHHLLQPLPVDVGPDLDPDRELVRELEAEPAGVVAPASAPPSSENRSRLSRRLRRREPARDPRGLEMGMTPFSGRSVRSSSQPAEILRGCVPGTGFMASRSGSISQPVQILHGPDR